MVENFTEFDIIIKIFFAIIFLLLPFYERIKEWFEKIFKKGNNNVHKNN